MTDVHTPEQRVRNMRAIGSSDTHPELVVRKAIHAAGLRYRLHVKKLPGTPDIVLPKFRSVIFVHGCFWHGHGCHLFKVPRTRSEFWLKKIRSNRKRDDENTASLLTAGWRVLTIWECAIKGRFRFPPHELSVQVALWLNSGSVLASMAGVSDQALKGASKLGDI